MPHAVSAVFVDASAWIASVESRQAHHDATLEVRTGLVEAGVEFLTTNLVLAETHAMLTRHRGPLAGLQLLDGVEADPQYTVLDVNLELQDAAVDHWLRVFRDQAFSLCDAVSFEVMRREGITRAFTLDHHFAVAGFAMLPAPRHRPHRRPPPPRPRR